MFTAFLIIIIFGTIVTFTLQKLNASYFNKNIPYELSDIYDNEAYIKSQKYEHENSKVSTFNTVLDTTATILLLMFSGFAVVDEFARSLSQSESVIGLLFFGILAGASGLLNLPFSIYDTFVIEQKFGFNKMSPKLFVSDLVKSLLLSAILGGALLWFVMWIFEKTQTDFWIYAWITVTVVMLLMTLFYSNIIVPLFNKQTPLPDGELRNKIEQFGQNVGFEIKNIYVIDGSKRSTKANAYFTGFGKKKRIVLYDTLIQDLDSEEILAVLAHEIGHYKKKHTLIGFLTGILQTGILLYIFSLFVGNKQIALALGTETVSFHISAIGFGILYSPLSLVVGILMNYISQKNEYAADNFAVKHNLGAPLISGLKKMSKKHLSNLTPHPLYVRIYFSHPTLYQRIKAINNASRN